MKTLFLIATLSCINLFASAQTGYIYVHESTFDENSNPATGGFGFNVSGGPTAVGAFTLNDDPTAYGVRDIGACSDGTLFASAQPNTFHPTFGNLYFRKPNSTSWVMTSVGNVAMWIDGGPQQNCIYSTSNNEIMMYNASSNASTTIVAANSEAIADVAFDRTNNRILYIRASDQTLWWASVAANNQTITGTFNRVGGGILGSRLDVDPSGNLVLLSSSNVDIYKITNYTGSPGVSYIGNLNTTDTKIDVAAADDGNYYVSGKGLIGKYTGGLTWNIELNGSVVSAQCTGGPNGQIWDIFQGPFQFCYGTVWARSIDASGAVHYLDDERIRTTPTNSNSILIPVSAGTYTITQNSLPSGWVPQSVTVYDPGNNHPSTSVSSSSASTTFTVTAGEVVHIIFQNTFLQSTAAIINTTSINPTVTENFGTGVAGSFGTIANGHVLAATNYHWIGTSTPKAAGLGLPDGYYAITTQSDDAGWGGANVVDHTSGNGTGNYLLINAGYETDVFYRRRFTGFTPNTPYAVRYWVANTSGNATIGGISGLRPVNISASVKDPSTSTILANNSTGDIKTVGVWTRYTLGFTPTSTSVDFTLMNNNIGGSGNDIGIDDITFFVASSLPVKLLNFNATKLPNNMAQLNWTTAEEQNVNYIEVQGSEDGISFTTFKTVAATNTNLEHKYSIATLLYGSTSYYRLKMVDLDGTVSYSNVAMLNSGSRSNNQSQRIKVLTNPAKEGNTITLTLIGYPSTVRGKLYNSMGQAVTNIKLSNGDNILPTNNLAAGIYYLTVINELNHNINTEKIVIR